MRRRNISGLVAPNGPGSERDLASDQRDPKDRQSLEDSDALRISPNAHPKSNHGDRDNEREKPMRHLQPDLEGVHVR